MDWNLIIVSGLSAVVGLGAPYLVYHQKRIESRAKDVAVAAERREREEAAAQARQDRLMNQLQEEVERLQADLATAREEIRQVYTQIGALRAKLIEAEMGARILIAQVVEAGDEPRWKFP